jgi:hypothetical protein
MIRGLLLSLALFAAAQVEAAAQPMPRSRQNLDAPAPGGGPAAAGGVVRLRGLDTLNGRVQDIDVPLGETVRFGHLDILAEACRVPPEGGTDAFALLRIRDIREEQPRFAGWMFAASPALSALDHPRYDVWVLSCSNR